MSMLGEPRKLTIAMASRLMFALYEGVFNRLKDVKTKSWEGTTYVHKSRRIAISTAMVNHPSRYMKDDKFQDWAYTVGIFQPRPQGTMWKDTLPEEWDPEATICKGAYMEIIMNPILRYLGFSRVEEDDEIRTMLAVRWGILDHLSTKNINEWFIPSEHISSSDAFIIAVNARNFMSKFMSV